MINIKNIKSQNHPPGFRHTTGISGAETNLHHCNTFPVRLGTLTIQRFTVGSQASLNNSGFTPRG